MLKFAKSVPYLPDLARSRPHVSDEARERAARRPPAPVPFHCKPWLDGQRAGWTLTFGYLTAVTISCANDGHLHVAGGEQLARETQQSRIIDQFAPGHFGLGTGYTLQTAPGTVSLILPPTQPPAHLQTVTGIVETDWYPRQLFLVFMLPAPGHEIRLDRGHELARVIVIPRQDQIEAQPLTDEELAALAERRAQYLAEEKESPSRWIAESGDTFTHLYKEWSQARLD